MGGGKKMHPPHIHPSPATTALNRGPMLQPGEAIRQETLSRKAEEVGDGAWEGRGCSPPQPFPAQPPPPRVGEGRSWVGSGERGRRGLRGDLKEAAEFSKMSFPSPGMKRRN